LEKSNGEMDSENLECDFEDLNESEDEDFGASNQPKAKVK